MAADERYILDASASSLKAQAFATGMLSRLGHSPTFAVRDFRGEAQLAPDPALSLHAKAASLALLDEVSEKDRREILRTLNEEVLESARYPEIEFRSTRIELKDTVARIEGDLTLHGVTRRKVITATLTKTGDSLRARGDFTVLQSDFNIKLVRVAGGLLKLKDEVRCTFEVLARRQTDSGTTPDRSEGQYVSGDPSQNR